MIEDNAGNVAVVFKQSIQKYIKIGNNEYVFIPNRNISLAWVKKEDVDTILSITGNCNCPNKHLTRGFMLANDAQHRIWSGIASR